MYYIYMVQCTDGSYYTGITPDICRRMQCHHAKKGAKYTRSHPVASLCALWRAEEKTAAARLEYAIKKRMSREEKTALIADPSLLPSLLPHLEASVYAYVPDVTLEMCLQGEFYDESEAVCRADGGTDDLPVAAAAIRTVRRGG